MLAAAFHSAPPPPQVDPLRVVAAGGCADLAVLLARFALRPDVRLCGTPHGAYANELAISARFVRALRDQGVRGRVLRLEGRHASAPDGQGRWAHAQPAAIAHVVAVVRGVVVDWTARQFDPAADFPMVCRTSALLDGWAHARRWSCERCGRVVEDLAHLSLADPRLGELHRFIAVKTAGVGPFPDRRFTGSSPTPARCRPGCSGQGGQAQGGAGR